MALLRFASVDVGLTVSQLGHVFAHPSLVTKAGVGLVTFAANAVVGGGAWVGNTIFRVLLRRQPNGSEKVAISLSPIQVSLL